MFFLLTDHIPGGFPSFRWNPSDQEGVRKLTLFHVIKSDLHRTYVYIIIF